MLSNWTCHIIKMMVYMGHSCGCVEIVEAVLWQHAARCLAAFVNMPEKKGKNTEHVMNTEVIRGLYRFSYNTRRQLGPSIRVKA